MADSCRPPYMSPSRYTWSLVYPLLVTVRQLDRPSNPVECQVSANRRSLICVTISCGRAERLVNTRKHGVYHSTLRYSGFSWRWLGAESGRGWSSSGRTTTFATPFALLRRLHHPGAARRGAGAPQSHQCAVDLVVGTAVEPEPSAGGPAPRDRHLLLQPA